MFQVIAIEEKAFGSTDYNKSPATQFKTSKDTQVGLGILVGYIFKIILTIIISMKIISVLIPSYQVLPVSLC